jgi:hypothetical protein
LLYVFTVPTTSGFINTYKNPWNKKTRVYFSIEVCRMEKWG